MRTRDELYRLFAKRFHAVKRIRPATEAQIAAAETALGVQWPESYRLFALSCGAIWSPSILDLVADRKPDFSDVQQFLTPRQSVTETRQAYPGTVDGSLVFASDCMGNLFLFRELPASPPRSDDAAVWLFDHEEDRMLEEAASFDAWLDRFLAL